MDDAAEVVTLQFREQTDGRKVSRLPGGKVVLIDLVSVDQVRDGDWWLVKLRHKDTFAVAQPLQKVAAPQARPGLETPPQAVPVAPATTAAEPTPVPVLAEKPRAALAIGGMLIEPHDVLRPTDRVAFFIDSANMDGAMRQAGFHVDYPRALAYFLATATFYGAFFYVADFTASDPMQKRFLDALSHNGFIVRRKPVKAIQDLETGERIIKGNLDTEIVLDMLNTVGNYDVAFLFSGDSDFERAVDLLRSRGKRVYVVTNRRSISRELAYIADKPVFFIEDFRGQIEKAPRAEPADSA